MNSTASDLPIDEPVNAIMFGKKGDFVDGLIKGFKRRLLWIKICPIHINICHEIREGVMTQEVKVIWGRNGKGTCAEKGFLTTANI